MIVMRDNLSWVVWGSIKTNTPSLIMDEGVLELIFFLSIHEGGMLAIKRPSKNNGSRGDHGINYK
jgi:hypothetical protein